MCEKLSKFWNGLDVTVKVNKRELVLELAVCALSGLVVGMFLSPRKQVTIGSNNASNNTDNGNNNTGDAGKLAASDEE